MRPADDEQTNSFNPTGIATIVWTVFLIATIAWTAFPLISNTSWAGLFATTSWAGKLEIKKLDEKMKLGLKGPWEIKKVDEKMKLGLIGP